MSNEVKEIKEVVVVDHNRLFDKDLKLKDPESTASWINELATKDDIEFFIKDKGFKKSNERKMLLVLKEAGVTSEALENISFGSIYLKFLNQFKERKNFLKERILKHVTYVTCENKTIQTLVCQNNKPLDKSYIAESAILYDEVVSPSFPEYEEINS